jgi:hypothetical protein
MQLVTTLRQAAATHAAPLTVVIGVFVVSAFFFGTINYSDPNFAGMDLHDYRAMAQAAPGLTGNIPAPFAFRVAGPWLAGMLPLADPISFRLLSLAVALALLLALYAWLISLKISSKSAVLGCAVLAFSKSTYGFLLFDYFQLNDLAALTFMCLALVAMNRSQWTTFWGLVLLSLLFRETSLILIPASAIRVYRRKQPRGLWGFAFGASLAVGLYLFLHLAVPHAVTTSLVGAFRIDTAKILNPASLFSSLFNTFVPVTLVPIALYSSTMKHAVRNPELVAVVVCSFLTTLVAFDSERLMMPAFFVVLACVAAQYDELGQPLLLGGATVTAAVLCGLSATLTVVSIPRPLSIALSISLTVAVALFWWYASRKRPGRGHRPAGCATDPSGGV